MKINNQEPDLYPSVCVQDPAARLIAGIVAQAARDIRSKNYLIALDALEFWIDPDGGKFLLDCLGFSVATSKVLRLIVGGDHDRKPG